MSLFKLSELRKGASIKAGGQEEDLPEDETSQATGTRSPGYLKSAIRGVGIRQLRDVIGELRHNEVIPYATGGQWSNHDMLEYILEKTGPAHVYITTWSLTEEPIRAILNLHNNGYILSLSCLFDYRIKERNAKVFQLASSIIERMKLTKIHAKVTVITNDTWGVSIISSANFTKNPRIEAGVILTDMDTADFNIRWIEAEIDNQQPLKFKSHGSRRRSSDRD